MLKNLMPLDSAMSQTASSPSCYSNVLHPFQASRYHGSLAYFTLILTSISAMQLLRLFPLVPLLFLRYLCVTSLNYSSICYSRVIRRSASTTLHLDFSLPLYFPNSQLHRSLIHSRSRFHLNLAPHRGRSHVYGPSLKPLKMRSNQIIL